VATAVAVAMAVQCQLDRNTCPSLGFGSAAKRGFMSHLVHPANGHSPTRPSWPPASKILAFQPISAFVSNRLAGEAIAVRARVLADRDQPLRAGNATDGFARLGLENLATAERIPAVCKQVIGQITHRYALRMALNEPWSTCRWATLHPAS